VFSLPLVEGRTGLESVDLFFDHDCWFSMVVLVQEEYVYGFLHGFKRDVGCSEERQKLAESIYSTKVEYS